MGWNEKKMNIKTEKTSDEEGKRMGINLKKKKSLIIKKS